MQFANLKISPSNNKTCEFRNKYGNRMNMQPFKNEKI
jgi:hypothetical protein